VIVVDDGSTDGSRAIIESFGSKITAIFQENSGQAGAMNTGYAATSGDIVLFLDADDKLLPGAVEAILGNWEYGLSKLHFPLEVIDAEGRPLGRLPTNGEDLPEGWLFETLLRNGTYHWMPTSGNAYSNAVLQRLMPIPQEDFKISADLYLSIKCVRFGPVKALKSTIGCYRVHGKNRYGSHRILATGREQLRARVSSQLARAKLMKEEAESSRLELDVSPEVHYMTFYGWLDLSLGARYLGTDALRPLGWTTITEGVDYRIGLRYEGLHKLVVGTLLRTIFSLIRITPFWLLKILLRVGAGLEPLFFRPLKILIIGSQFRVSS